MAKKFARTLKMLVLVLIILPVLIFLGFAAAVNFMDFNGYKPQIEKQVSELTGRQFNIEGSIDVNVLPFTLSIGESQLNSPEGFNDKYPQLAFKSLLLQLSLSELFLAKTIEVKSIEWLEPSIYWERNAQTGQSNWDNFPRMDQLIASIKGQSGTESEANAWKLDSLVVQDGSFRYKSVNSQKLWTLQEIEVVANHVGSAQPFPLSLSFLHMAADHSHQFDVQLNADGKILNQWQGIALQDWRGILKSQPVSELPQPAVTFIQSGKHIQLNWSELGWSGNGILLNGLNGHVNFDFKGRLAPFELSGQAALNKVNLNQWSEVFGFSLSENLKKAVFTDNQKYNWQYLNGEVSLISEK